MNTTDKTLELCDGNFGVSSLGMILLLNMRRHISQFNIFPLLFAAAILLPAVTLAAPKSQSRAISCPKFIADEATGGVRTVKAKDGTLRCYRTDKDAKADGFIKASQLKDYDFKGWWRLRFKKVRDTCGRYSSNTGLVLFLQISQHGEAAFGDFCPDLGRLVGGSTGHGISISKTETKVEINNPLACRDGKVEVTEKLELDKVLDGSVEYRVKVSDVRRCPGLDEGMKTCTTTLEGVAFPETHKIWPPVDSNTSVMGNACLVALNRCSECHDNLSAPPKNQ